MLAKGGFIHYNVQHVVFIGTCITSNWQFALVNFKCQNVISIEVQFSVITIVREPNERISVAEMKFLA
jgi:hypothetical protein